MSDEEITKSIREVLKGSISSKNVQIHPPLEMKKFPKDNKKMTIEECKKFLEELKKINIILNLSSHTIYLKTYILYQYKLFLEKIFYISTFDNS